MGVEVLVQIDRLVQLLETPVFNFLRLHLLHPARYPALLWCATQGNVWLTWLPHNHTPLLFGRFIIFFSTAHERLSFGWLAVQEHVRAAHAAAAERGI